MKFTRRSLNNPLKKLFFSKLLVLFLLTSFLTPGFTEEYANNPNALGGIGDDATAKYLKALGDYFGYDLTEDTSASSDMLGYTLNVVVASSTGKNILYAMLRAIPINAAFATFFTNTPYDGFNTQTANTLFSDYDKGSSEKSVSTAKQFDQKEWQKDPVSQAVLNLVGTPDLNTCPDSKNASPLAASATSCLSSYQVMLTALSNILTDDGELPGEYEYMSYSTNTSKFVSQLNSNNLIGPMVYDTSNPSKDAFPAGSQLQQAQAFIRYATEGVLPVPTMSPSDYSRLRNLAYPPTTPDGHISATLDVENMNNAKTALATYLLNLRVYAAKSSVAVSNLYAILSKRMPQDAPDGESTSQAVNEMHMASWRLYNPATKQESDQWAQQINGAAPSTIQKEMAILLSEINYQLYLNRQQQERLLLTNSMILMQLLSMGKPSRDFPTSVSEEANKAQEEAPT